ncbi:MAG: nucleotidyltransferase family protein [Marinomonas colpomeniae]|uniref:Nucleotidyltransferase family protein n=2 Tax=Marinomonas colpomeniae TaxID=2774408 RepID=A0ABR8P0Y0_9GAMM|nr:nucleotidyltransferase family protein [Marinomonas colpomeniae]
MLVDRLPVAVMAAGISRRFGSDKRSYRLPDGRTMIQFTLDQLVNAHSIADILVVTSGTSIIPDLSYPVPILIVENSVSGLGSSLNNLFGYVTREPRYRNAPAIGVYLADMPAIQVSTMTALKAKATASKIVRPTYKGVAGHPVWIGRAFWSEFLSLSGDDGGKQILKQFKSKTEFVEIDDPGVVLDIDTPLEAMAWWESSR